MFRALNYPSPKQTCFHETAIAMLWDWNGWRRGFVSGNQKHHCGTQRNDIEQPQCQQCRAAGHAQLQSGAERKLDQPRDVARLLFELSRVLDGGDQHSIVIATIKREQREEEHTKSCNGRADMKCMTRDAE